MPGIGLNPSGCCCGGATCAGCPSCPTASLCVTLTIAWTNGQIGGGQTGLANQAGGCAWASGCVGVVSFVFDMTGPAPTLRARVYAAGQCPGGTPAVDCTLAASSVNCAPLIVTFQVTNAACPGLWTRGYQSFTVSR